MVNTNPGSVRSATPEDIQPRADYMVVRRDEVEEMTEGGILLSPGARESAHTGTVVSVGPGRKMNGGFTIPMQVSVGDKVAFSQHLWRERLNVGGEDVIIINEEQVLGVLS